MRSKIVQQLLKGENPLQGEDPTLFPEVTREPQKPRVVKLHVKHHARELERPHIPGLPQGGANNKKSQRAYLYAIQKGRCLFCEEPFTAERKPTLDHIIPKSKGGSDGIENKCLVCESCNGIKANFATFMEAAEYAAKVCTESYRKEKDAMRLLVLMKRLRDKGIIT